MSEAIRKQYCVGGVWKDSKTEKWMPVTDSSTGEVIAEVPSCTQDEVLEAIDAADKAFKEWSQVSVSKRTQMMFKWRNILVEHLDELTYLCAKELGKNLSEARGDVLKAIEPTELACATPFVSQGSASLQVTTGFDTATYRMPLGVVAGIVPFNFPAMIPWGWMVPLAIATGNTVVLKAASQTPLTAMRIMELFYEEGGFPAGVVNLVTCSRGESEVLLTDPRVKAVTFVGTTEVGKHIYSIAAAHGKRVQAQCEAKNHALVLEDCDLESTVNAIINSTYGCAGMRCMALPVIVVQESIADKFVALLREKAMAMKVGCAYDPETKLGPVVSAKHKKSICDWIQRGIDDGAELVLDGRDIGTVVLPDAGLKIFLSASAECRAQRRYRQLQEKGIEEPYADVLRELEQRDYDDTHRAVAPLKAAPDAVHIDTSDLTLDESIDAVCAAIRTRFGVEGKA